MLTSELSTTDGLRAAAAALGEPREWEPERGEWVKNVAQTIRRIRAASQAERARRDFQQWLWEDNEIAAVGQGNIPVDRAIDDEAFRTWLAERSLAPLPTGREERARYLQVFYRDLRERLSPYLDRKVPHLKIFRVMAALFPQAMTTVASAAALSELVRALGGPRGLEPVERHVWVRDRLDAALGPADDSPEGLSERMTIPWLLYERFVLHEADSGDESQKDGNDEKAPLEPLPPARRRRGLTAVKGLFQGVLSTLEFARPGRTRDELIDFLKASSPETKVSSLGVAINSLQGELGVIRLLGDRYVLTQQGEDVLESQDAAYLADWLLTRILGVDRAVVELRDRGALPPSELLAAIKSMNPGWTSSFTPQAIVSWLRSMGVIETTSQGKHALTSAGRQWADRVHWTPEPLAKDPAGLAVVVLPPPEPRPAEQIELPSLTEVIASIQDGGYLFDVSLIARLHVAVWANTRRHFAIFTGLSGAGKTLLARRYGRAITAGDASRVLTVPVQPGWYDPGALLGYVNPLHKDSYVYTPFLQFLIAASADPSLPYVVILDEMNLSHPEQYMAPLLSAMETGDAIQLHQEDDFFDGVPSGIPYPSNLVILGTVNMDETTHGLSDKVLDRAFVVEFWKVDLNAYPRWHSRGLPAADEAKVQKVLTTLMEVLEPVRLHFGWRVVDETLDFLKRAQDASHVLPFESALDGLIYAKVLPKLRGEDSPRLREALASCEKALTQFALPSSSAKVAELLADLKSTGTARFWR